jgi:hypothetical protein
MFAVTVPVNPVFRASILSVRVSVDIPVKYKSVTSKVEYEVVIFEK